MTLQDQGIYVRRDYGQAKTVCPECSHTRKKPKDPCLSVNIDEKTWNCHHCGWSGGIKRERNEMVEMAKRAKPRPVVKEPETDLPETVLAWFAERKITYEVLHRNKIGCEQVWMPGVDAEVSTIAFPFFKDGKVVNIKYRDGKKNFRQVKDAEKVFYGLDDVIDVAIICEGEMDKLSVEVAGFKNCLSVPDGAPSPEAKSYEAKFSYLENCKEAIGKFKKIILAVDNDAPGQKLERELIRRFDSEICWRVTWPEGCKDANEVLIQHGEVALKRCIDNAKPVPVSGLHEANDFLQDLLYRYDHGIEGGASTGFLNLDDFYTVKTGQCTYVTGIPSHGKSEFMDALAINIAEIHDWRFGIFSPENQPVDSHLEKLVCKRLRQPFYEGVTQRMGRDSVLEAMEWVNQRFYFVLPEDDEYKIDNILDKARIAVLRYGIKGLIIDPWTEIDHSRKQGLSETEYISQALSKIRRFAKKRNVHVWVIAHPTKLQKLADGSVPVPTMYDIAGSANWYNKADNGLSIWRDVLNPGEGVQVYVQKVRFKEIGKVGVVTFDYNYSDGCYSPRY